jgi:hypothetical protein
MGFRYGPYMNRQAMPATLATMHRIAWITAACIIDRHRDNAIDVVQQRLNELEEDRARGGSSAELEYWCEIGRALLEILRATREVGEASH